MKMRTTCITCFDNRTSDTFLIIASVSRTDNLWMWMFWTVLHRSPRVLSHHCVLHYFLTMLVGFNFNLTFGLKPQVGGIKIVTVFKRSVFQVEWLTAILIEYASLSTLHEMSSAPWSRAKRTRAEIYSLRKERTTTRGIPKFPKTFLLFKLPVHLIFIQNFRNLGWIVRF